MAKKGNEGQLILALRAMEQNSKLSIREPARIYSVDRTTLARRRRGQPSRRSTIANWRKLTNLEESAIIQYILDLDSRSFPPRASGVQVMANRLLDAVAQRVLAPTRSPGLFRGIQSLKHGFCVDTITRGPYAKTLT